MYYIDNNGFLVEYSPGCGCCSDTTVINLDEDTAFDFNYYSTKTLTKEEVREVVTEQINKHLKDAEELMQYLRTI